MRGGRCGRGGSLFQVGDSGFGLGQEQLETGRLGVEHAGEVPGQFVGVGHHSFERFTRRPGFASMPVDGLPRRFLDMLARTPGFGSPFEHAEDHHHQDHRAKAEEEGREE